MNLVDFGAGFLLPKCVKVKNQWKHLWTSETVEGKFVIGWWVDVIIKEKQKSDQDQEGAANVGQIQ